MMKDNNKSYAVSDDELDKVVGGNDVSNTICPKCGVPYPMGTEHTCQNTVVVQH